MGGRPIGPHEKIGEPPLPWVVGWVRGFRAFRTPIFASNFAYSPSFSHIHPSPRLSFTGPIREAHWRPVFVLSIPTPPPGQVEQPLLASSVEHSCATLTCYLTNEVGISCGHLFGKRVRWVYGPEQGGFPRVPPLGMYTVAVGHMHIVCLTCNCPVFMLLLRAEQHIIVNWQMIASA